MNRGWFLVVIGVLFSSFLGGAIRVTFSPERMRAFVEELARKKEPKFTFSFGGAELLLHDGWWPTLAVELHDVKMHAKDPCITSSSLDVKRLTLPLSISALRTKTVHFGRISAGSVRFNHLPPTCTSTADLDLDPDDYWLSLERFFRERWSKEVLNSKRYFDEFIVDHFEYFGRDEKPIFALNDLELIFMESGAAAKIEFKFLPSFILAADEPFGPTSIELSVRSNEVRFTASGNLKEGQLNAQGLWDIDDGTLDLTHNFRDVPIKNVLALAQHWSLFPEIPLRVQNAGSRCQLTFTGPVREWRKHPLSFKDCEVYGDIGKAVLVTKFAPLNKIYPLDFTVLKGDLRKTMESIGFAKSWGLVRKFGDFEGHLRIDGPTEVEVSGQVTGAEFFLSTVRDQTRETLDSLAVAVAFKDQRFSGQFSNLVVSGDSADGFMTFNFGREGDGAFQVAFEELRLSPTAQDVLFGGQVPNISLFGQGEFGDLQLKQFTGEIGIDEVVNSFINVKGMKLKIEGDGVIWNLVPTITSLVLKADGPWSGISQSLRDNSNDGDPVYSDLHGIVVWRDGVLQWTHLKGSVDGTMSRIASDGQWTSNGNFSGYVQIENKKTGIQRWSLDGTTRQLSLKAVETH